MYRVEISFSKMDGFKNHHFCKGKFIIRLAANVALFIDIICMISNKVYGARHSCHGSSPCCKFGECPCVN
jgi:hypothetical protein